MNDWITTAKDWAQMNTTKTEGQAPYVYPAPEKLESQLTPWTPWLLGPWEVMYVEIHTAKHAQQKNDHVYIHTTYIVYVYCTTSFGEIKMFI